MPSLLRTYINSFGRGFLRKFYLFTLFSFLFCFSYGQIAAWDFTGESALATSTADIYNVNLDASNLMTRGAGAAASLGANSFRTVGFQNNGIATTNTDFFQITLSAVSGYILSLSTIDARFAGTSTYAVFPGVSNQFAYSLDNVTYTLIGSPQLIIGTPGTLTQINLSGISALQNIPASTTVYFRCYASGQTTTGGWGFNSPAAGQYGLAIGGTVTTAGPTTPTLTTPTSASITTTSATLGATITANGGAAITARGTVWGTNAAPTTNLLAEGGTTVSAFSHSRTGLTPNTLYYYRGYAVNSAGTGYSPDGTFTTLHNAPTIGTGGTIATTSFTANWTAPTGGGSANFGYEIQVCTASDFSATILTYNIAQSATPAISISCTGLTAGTTYYYRVRVVNAGGNSAWSGVSAAVTTAVSVPTVSTTTVSSISHNGVVCGGNVTATGGSAVSERGVVFGPALSPAYAGGGITTFGIGSGLGIFSATINSLQPQTLYYYRAYAINSAFPPSAGYGNPSLQFYTLSAPAVLPAANLVANASSSTQIDLSWDAASWPASGATIKGYVLIRNTGSAPAFTIANGVAPTSWTITSGTILSSAVSETATTFSNTSLSQLTSYFYTLVPFTWNGTNNQTYNYSSPISASATTPLGPCIPPVTQATAAVVNGPTAGTLNISWAAGSGDRTLVIVRQGAAVNVSPSNGVSYTASAAFSAGANLGSGNFVCYNGTASAFTLTNLTAATTYHVAVFTYNNSGYCFNLVAPATGSATTSLPPTIIETFEPSVKGTYAAGNLTGVLGGWNFNNALIGTTAGSDRFNGTRSARIQSTGTITSLFDKTNGLGFVQVYHALFGADPSTTWRFDVSDDGGATFTAWQSPVQTTTSTTLDPVNFTVNIPGNNIRVRIVKLSGGTTSRLNIDDISLGDFVSTNTVSTGIAAGSPFCITSSSGAAISVPFTSTGVFNPGNVYTVQLSDASGSFSSPLEIGTLASVATSGNITATIPAGTLDGTGYRTRVISSDPYVTGSTSASLLSVFLNTPEISNLSAGTANNNVALGWINPTGCFDEVLVLAGTAPVSCAPSGNGSAYTANASYGSGTSCSGSFVVYKGSATSQTITGLTNGTTYYFRVFCRKGTSWSSGVSITAVPNDYLVGDYRSRSGPHNYTTDASAWQVYAGSNVWNNTATPPNGATVNVYITSGSTVELTTSMATSPIRNLTVEAGGIIRGNSTGPTYLTIYGDVVCNGTIGNGTTWNSMGLNMEGINSTISGASSGVIDLNRLRKGYSVNATSNLIIAKDLNLRWNSASGTTLYNNTANTTFNVTINAGTTVNIIIDPTAPAGSSGNACIDGVFGNDVLEKGGTFTVNGTLNVPGVLYATTNNTTLPCKWVIGPDGRINCNQVNSNASGTATHTIEIQNGGVLNINTNVGFSLANFSTTNNVFNFQPGSTVEYSAPSGITNILTDLTYSNLLLSGGGTRSLVNSLAATTGLILAVNKNLTITGTTSLDPISNTVNVGGNWSNYNSVGFNEGTSLVNFTGFSGAQKIICSGGEAFFDMQVDNNTPSGVELNTDVEVKDDLTLGSVGRLFFGPTPSILRLSKMTPGSNSLIGTAGALVDMSGSASTLFVGCENLNYTGTFNAGTSSLVNYNRDASNSTSGGSGNQNVTTGFAYANLSFSGSNTKNTDDNFIVNGTLTVDGPTTSLEALLAGRTLTLGGDLILSGGGTMGGSAGASCLNNLSILTTGNTVQNFNAGFASINCFNLTTDKTGNGIALTTASTTLNVSNNLTQLTAAQLTPNDNRVKIGNAWNLWGPAGFNKGTSTVEYYGSVPQTIIGVNYFNLESSSTGIRTMATSNPIGIANIFTPGTNNYTFTNSTVDYNGTANQSIAPFIAGATPGSTYNNLTFSGSGTKSLTGNTDVEGDLSLNNSAVFALGNQYLNLKSTSVKTARVAPVAATAAITYGNGRFVVERYFPGKRAWRLVTAPVTADAGNTFYNSWQVGGSSSLSGSGTYITGPNPSVANGLDASPQNNSSLKTFNQSTGLFDPVLNTKTTRISGTAGAAGAPDNIGYFLFVRGDRTPANNANAFNPYGSINETTLRDTGKIQTGNYTFACNPSIVTNYLTLVGNPYASPVDFDNISRSGVANKFWAWDPNLNSVGGYAIVDRQLGTTTTVPSGGATTQDRFIQSKQAFFVQTTGASPSVTFGENSKSGVNNLNLFRPQNIPNFSSLAVNMFVNNSDGSSKIADGILNQFSEQFANATDQLDALRFSNVNETFGVLNSSTNLMLNRRQFPKAGDTLFFRMVRFSRPAYTAKISAAKLIRENLAAYWEDNFLKTSTALSMDGESSIDFNTSSDVASRAADRFRIVFRKLVDFTSIKADLLGKDVSLQWMVNEENDIDHYEIERSADGGTNFTKLGAVPSRFNGRSQEGSYSHTDFSLQPGVYHYRIKAVSSRGVVAFSTLARVVVMSTAGNLYVFPNPVRSGRMNLQLNKIPAGDYQARLIATDGQVVFTSAFTHDGSAGTRSFRLPPNLSPAAYTFEIYGNAKEGKWLLPLLLSSE